MTVTLEGMVLLALLSASFSAGGAWLALGAKVAYLRRDVDELRALHGVSSRHSHTAEGL